MMFYRGCLGSRRSSEFRGGTRNRWFDRSAALIQEILSEGESGKAALEGLLNYNLPMVRATAAANVLRWAPEHAIPVLNELLAWAYSERDPAGRRPVIAGFVLLDVEGLLAVHYGIDINDVLPRALGVEE
jgi:hypothetical protein